MCCLVRGDEQSCRIHALAAFLVPFGGRRMDGSDGYPLIRDPTMQTFSSTTYVRIIFVVMLFAALKKKGKKACVLLPVPMKHLSI